MNEPDLIVVGGGIAGSAAVLRAAQYHLRAVWITGDRETRRASRAAYVRNIDNMIGIHPGVALPRAADLLRSAHPEAARLLDEAHLHISTEDVVAEVRARLALQYAAHAMVIEERATGASRTDAGFRVRTSSGAEYGAPALVLATGVMDRQPVIHRTKGGRDLSGIHWIYPFANHETFLYCIRCEGHLTAGRRVAVIGAGDAAAEVALTLVERYAVRVVILPAGDDPSWSARRARLLERRGVRILPGRLVEVRGSDRGATLTGFVLEGGAAVEADLAFVAMGLYRVYNELARELGADLEEGDAPLDRRHVLIDARGETAVPGLYAVGDMAMRRDEPVMKQIYTAQEYAVRAVDRIDRRRRSADRDRILRD